MGHQIETCWGNRHLSMFSIWPQACKSAIFIHRLQSPQSEYASVLSSNLSHKTCSETFDKHSDCIGFCDAAASSHQPDPQSRLCRPQLIHNEMSLQPATCHWDSAKPILRHVNQTVSCPTSFKAKMDPLLQGLLPPSKNHSLT